MLHPNCHASQATRKLWPSQLPPGCIRHAARAHWQPAAHTVAAAAAQARKASAGPVDAAGKQAQQLGQQQQQQQLMQADPPDVSPHVLLSLDPIWLADGSSSSSSGGGSANPAADYVQQAGSYSNSTHGDNHHHHQQQQQLLVPRTSTRLHGMSPPGFLPRTGGWAADPQVALWQQQASQIWREAAAWAQQQQQQQHDMQQQQPVWLQQLSAQQQQQPHWGAVAAAIEAAGPCLQLQHLATLAELLANLVICSNSSKSRRNTGNTDNSSSSDGSRSNGSSTTDPLRLLIMAVAARSEHILASRDPVSNGNGSFSSSSSSSVEGNRVVMSCSDVLPKLTLLAHEQLRQQQQQQLQNSPAAIRCTSSLDSNNTVQLLQHLSVCHKNGSLGRANPDAVSALIGTVDVQATRLADLSGLISSCARLGHALRSSWLDRFVQAAVSSLQKEAADAAAVATTGSAGATAVGGSSSSSTNTNVADKMEDSLLAAVARLLDGLSLYPGPHNAPERLQPFLAACEPHVHSTTPAQLHMLLTAAAHLSLPPSDTLLHSAAAAARRQFGMASLRELVLLLQGLTAASGWQQQQQQQQQQQISVWLDDVWWQRWYEAAATRCAAITLAASVADDTTAAAAAMDSTATGTEMDHHLGSNTSSNTSASSAETAMPQWATLPDGADMLQQQQQQQLSESEQAPAELLCEVCLILLEHQQQVHPLWLAGVLEAYQRSAYSAASTPQLLLLVSELLEQPAAFAVRHKVLLQQLIEPLQEHLAELTEEQLTQATEVCSVYECKPGAVWFRWHAAAVLRFGRFYPLEGLARIRAAYSRLEVVPEERMQQMLETVPWRLERQEERQRQLERLEKHRATLTAKNEQRRRQNEMDKAKKVRKKSGVGPGPGPDGKQQWRKRKLKPPGTLNRKF